LAGEFSCTIEGPIPEPLLKAAKKGKENIPKPLQKIHFTGLFFLHAMRACFPLENNLSNQHLNFQKFPEKVGAIVEGTAADHMVRLSFLLCEQKQLFNYEDEVTYWRGKKDREVDFILSQGLSKPAAIEVKYQPKITSRDTFGIIDFMKATGSSNAIILSKETLETRKTSQLSQYGSSY
jgi:predicted AAA+ superfamily ATPase